MVLYYACFVVLQMSASFNVSAIDVFADCTGNHYLVRQVCSYKMFLKENSNIFLLLKDYSAFTLIIISILPFIKDKLANS